MALGDNTNSKFQDPTYYSRFKVRSGNLTLGFKFWKGLLAVSISEQVTANGSFEYKDLSTIHISPTKARLLANSLDQYLQLDLSDDSRVFGVETGVNDTRSIIAFGNENMQRYVIIGKVDPQGRISQDSKFIFNSDFHSYLEWSNFEKMECEKVFNDELEIAMIVTLLRHFSDAMSGAIGYAVADLARYDYARTDGKLNAIMEALKIPTNSNSNKNTGNSFFNKAGAASPQNSNRGRSNSTTMEDISDLLS